MYLVNNSWGLCVFSRGTEWWWRVFPLYQEEKISVSKMSSFRVKWKYSSAEESGGLGSSPCFSLPPKGPQNLTLVLWALCPLVCRGDAEGVWVVISLRMGCPGTMIQSHTSEEFWQGFGDVCGALKIVCEIL